MQRAEQLSAKGENPDLILRLAENARSIASRNKISFDLI